MIVQAREVDALGPEKKLAARLGDCAAIAAAPGAFLVAAAVLFDRGRKARVARDLATSLLAQPS